MSHIVVTGANGFVGRALCRLLLENAHTVTGLVRTPGQCGDLMAGLNGLGETNERAPRWREWVFRGDDYAGLADAWPRALQPDCVIHLAARVHVMKERAHDPDAAFRATNVEGAQRVALAASQRGVKRFVFVSSIKAMAETDGGAPLRETGAAAPQDAYGRSKLAAEQALRALHDASGLEVVTVRPPLVYGPGVRANFLRMMDALWRGLPLPLGAVHARRSLVYVGNLADALLHVATDPRAANQCFHVADDDAPNLPELLRRTAAHLGKPAHLLAVPPGWLRTAERLLSGGSTKRTDRLTHSLRVDTSHLRATLDWRAPWSLDAGLAATARWYRATRLAGPVDMADMAVDTARPATGPLNPAQPAHATPPTCQNAQPEAGVPPQTAGHDRRFSTSPASGQPVPQAAGNPSPGN